MRLYKCGKIEDTCRNLTKFLLQERKREARVSLQFKRKILEIAKNIAKVMIEVHDMKVIHGDLKPSNWLKDADGKLKLADFGNAMLETAKEKVAVGTTR